MTEGKQILINQSQGLAASGEQRVEINQSISNYPILLKNLVQTHNGAIRFDPKHLRTVILAVAEVYDELEQKPADFGIVDIEEKNKINGLDQEFYDNFVSRDYEPYFFELDEFLGSRDNEDLHGLVGKIVKSLNKRIFLARDLFTSFEGLVLSLEDAMLESNNESLGESGEVVSLFLFYLYANCYIGRKVEGEEEC